MLYPFIQIVLGCEDSFDKVKDKSEPIAACQSGCEFQKSESPKSVKISKIEESKEDNENNVVVPFLTIQVCPSKTKIKKFLFSNIE